MNKTCFKCKTIQPLENFYKHSRMADGHLGKCKECAKKDVNERYYDPSFRKTIADYEKARFKTTHRKEKVYKYTKTRREKDPLKYKARTAVSNAVRDKILFREPCIHCGNPKSQAHHHDYSKPLDVVWVCFKCHREKEHGQKLTETILKEKNE